MPRAREDAAHPSGEPAGCGPAGDQDEDGGDEVDAAVDEQIANLLGKNELLGRMQVLKHLRSVSNLFLVVAPFPYTNARAHATGPLTIPAGEDFRPCAWAPAMHNCSAGGT